MRKTEEQGMGKKKKIKIIIVVAVFVLVAIAALFIVHLKVSEKKISEQLVLGNKYLTELNYEQALIAYETILEIDSKNVEANLAVVEICIQTEFFEKALAAAELGYEKTSDENLKKDIDMIKSGNIINDYGKLINILYYDANGDLEYYDANQYYSDGLIRYIRNYDVEGNLLSLLSYDAHENEIKKEIYSSDGQLDYYEEYEYNEDGYMAGSTYYNSDNVLIKESYYEYDSSEEPVYSLKTEYDETGNVLSSLTTVDSDWDFYSIEETWEYDENGNMLSSLETGEYDGYFYSIEETWEYNMDNLLIKYNQIQINQNEGEEEEKFEFEALHEYDSDNLLIKINRYRNGEFSTSEIFEYDEAGNNIMDSFYDDEGELYMYEKYEYDINGYCIKKTWYNPASPCIHLHYYIYENDEYGNRTKTTEYTRNGTVVVHESCN